MTASARVGDPAPVVMPAWVRYRKDDVFEVCCALALAEVLLAQTGHRAEAARMAAVFELVEAGLAGGPGGSSGAQASPVASGPPRACSPAAIGSKASASEFTQ